MPQQPQCQPAAPSLHPLQWLPPSQWQLRHPRPQNCTAAKAIASVITAHDQDHGALHLRPQELPLENLVKELFPQVCAFLGDVRKHPLQQAMRRLPRACTCASSRILATSPRSTEYSAPAEVSIELPNLSMSLCRYSISCVFGRSGFASTTRLSSLKSSRNKSTCSFTEATVDGRASRHIRAKEIRRAIRRWYSCTS